MSYANPIPIRFSLYFTGQGFHLSPEEQILSFETYVCKKIEHVITSNDPGSMG